MDDYDRLTTFLTSQSSNEVKLTFDDLEDDNVVGARLPPLARAHRLWWENQVSGYGRHCHAWLSVGWSVRDVRLGEGFVIFGRSTITFRFDRLRRPVR